MSLPLPHLVAAMPEGTVSVVTRDRAGAPALTGVELLDCPEAAHEVPTGRLLLGVGLDPAGDAARTALDMASRAGAVLAVKCPLPAPAGFVVEATRRGVAVLAVDPRVPWSRVQSIVATLLTGSSPRGEGRFAGGDLFSLADAVAAIVGGAVAIMDIHRVVVAYSALPGQPIDDTRRRGILGRQVPEDAVAAHLDSELWRGDAVVRHHRPGDLPRLAVAIRAGQDVLGSLWVAFPPQGPAGNHEAALREAAQVAALHLLALRRQVDADQDGRNRALRAAVEAPPHSDTSRTGIRLPGVLVGVAESTDPGAPADARGRADLMRMVDLVAIDGRSLGYEAAAAVIDDRLYALLPTTAAALPLDQFLDHLLQRAHQALRRRYTVVRSDAVAAPAGLRDARRDIDAALDHLHDAGAAPGSYRAEELRADLVLRRLLRTVREHDDLRTGTAELIAAHDAEHGTAYLATLSAYLRHFGDVVAASAALHIHQNTLRQRLRKAERTFGLSLGDPTQRLVLAVEIAARSQS